MFFQLVWTNSTCFQKAVQSIAVILSSKILLFLLALLHFCFVLFCWVFLIRKERQRGRQKTKRERQMKKRGESECKREKEEAGGGENEGESELG